MADTNARMDPQASKGDGIVWMTPAQYLALTPDLKKPEQGSQAESLRESIGKGEPIAAAPSLTIKDGKVTAQDGRHRAYAMQTSGFGLIPVKVDGEIPKDGKVTSMMGGQVQLDAGRLQAPKPWSAVSKSPEYRRLSPEQRDAARTQYFDQVVSPRVGKADRDLARQQFMGQTEFRVAPTEAERKAVDPTNDMSAWERGRAGAGKAMSDLGTGVRSMLPASIGGTKPGEVEQFRREDAPLMATTGGRVGNIAGSIGTAIPASLIPGANTVAGAGAVGALYGALQPAESWSERGGNALEGGLTGGAITGGVRAVPTVFRALVDPFRQAGQERIALDTIGRFAKDPNVLSKPMNDVELVPGSRRTLAEVTGDPGVAQLQRVAQAASPETASTFAEARTARLQARKDALMNIAGDAHEKEFFEAARDATANRLYGEALKAPIDQAAVKAAAPQIADLLKRPSIQAAQKDAVRIAQEEGVKLSPKKLADGSIESLHYMKKSLDGMISKAKTAGDSAEAARLLDTQKKLLGVMDQLSPDYKAARAVYAADSKPINRMEVGRYLYGELFPAATDVGAEKITPNKFLATLKKGDELAQRATGFKGARLADILTTDDMNSLVGLAHDLGGEMGALERAKVPGSPTAQYQSGKNMLRQVAGPLGLPKGWIESTLADYFSQAVTFMGRSPVEQRVQARLAQFLTDPQTAAAAAARRADLARSIPMSALNFGGQRALPPLAVGVGAYSANGQ
ncbi:MAG: hypothetical protein PVS3B2_00420 [Candidatus Dormibacteraceae bacterium]